jgi:hypothetical protein
MKTILPLVTAVAVVFLSSCQKDELDLDKRATPASEHTVNQSTPIGIEEAFPGQVGTVEKGYLFGQSIEYAMIKGQAVFQGDIILTKEQLSQNPPSSSKNGRTEGAGRTLHASRWPNNIVFYSIDPSLPDQARVTGAIAHWESNSGLRFVRRTTQANFITFRPSDGCSSSVGMIGGQQFLNLGPTCTMGNAIHEIGHALGLWHEQSRTDRDSFITIRWGNIEPGKEHNFHTYQAQGSDGFNHGNFDFNSIMMYSSFAFTKDATIPTMTRKDGSTFMSQRSGLSDGDRAIIDDMYSTGLIYGVALNGDLLWYRHDGRNDGSFVWAANSARKVGIGWNFKQVFSGGNGVIYGVALNGDLLWYRHDGRNDGSFVWAANSARKVGIGWNFKQVFSGGNGVIYAVAQNGDLLWYRHDGRNDGSFVWAANSGRKVGTGWNFKQVFSGGNGVIYGVALNGDLLWYRHDGRNDGSFVWAANSARKVGIGWNFKQIFSGSNGVIYGVALNGDLLWYRHDGRNDGSFAWAANSARKVGIGWNFNQVFSN